jgi:hypothetical protein
MLILIKTLLNSIISRCIELSIFFDRIIPKRSFRLKIDSSFQIKCRLFISSASGKMFNVRREQILMRPGLSDFVPYSENIHRFDKVASEVGLVVGS